MVFAVLTVAVVLTAALAPVIDYFTRAHSPRPDLYLAAAASTPAAAQVAMTGAQVDAPRFFTVPLFDFIFDGRAVTLTVPDVLAIVSSAVLAIRFLAWAIAPVVPRRKDKE